MTPKKRTTKKEAAPAPLPTVETNPAAPKAKKPSKAPAPQVDAVAAPKRAVPKMIKAAKPKATKVAKRVEPEVPIDVQTSIAANDPVQPARPAITAEDIRPAAFYLSQRRRGPSDPVADWLEAERMLLARMS